MNKITVVPVFPGDQKFDWNKQEYDPGKERLVFGKPVEITDEEIEREACEYSEEAYLSYLACWNYIKSKIR